jgi:DNA-binding NtrC family response regulator
MESDEDRLPTGMLDGLIGFSAQMQRVYRTIHAVSTHDYAVLITGESGTGKQLAARSIHSLGSRQDKPFVPVECSSLSPTLIESELFGYAKGAFAGTSRAKWGMMAFVDQGTLFLNEVADLSMPVQARVQRTLQDAEFTPIGSNIPVPFHGRVIASTRQDLQVLVTEGKFREDLFSYLNAMQVVMPTLRERKSDIPLLVDSFIERYTEPNSVIECSGATMKLLLAYDWPDNVRELDRAVQHAISRLSGPMIQPGDLDSHLRNESVLRSTEELIPLDDLEFERRAIVRTLKETHGNKTAASRILGIGESTLYRRLKFYGLATWF